MWGNCRIIGKKRVAKALLANPGLGFQSGNVEESSIRSCSEVNSFSWRLKDVFQHYSEEGPKYDLSQNTPLFHST